MGCEGPVDISQSGVDMLDDPIPTPIEIPQELSKQPLICYTFTGLIFEGLFELLSLSGSFMPNENGGTRSRSGGMSVSLASSDGRVVGGGVAGMLVAASPVQIVVGSFLPGYRMEQKSKKSKLETTSASFPSATIQIPSSHVEEAYSSDQGTSTSAMPKTTHATTSFRGETWSSSPPSVPDDTRNFPADINAT